MPSIKRILVPTDFSQQSDSALDYATTLAEVFKASLVLLYVFEDPLAISPYQPDLHSSIPPAAPAATIQSDQTQLGSRVAMAQKSGQPVSSDFVWGNPSKIIPEYAAAHDIDLIVMGTHGRTGVAHLLLGSVAERVVRVAPCPVLSVRPPNVLSRPPAKG